MKKIYSFLDEYIVQVCILISVIVGLILLNSCNPVKQVLKDEGKMREVWEKGVLKNWCSNDSVYTSDTTVLLDTLHVVESTTDTLKVDSIIYITKTDYKTITKTVTIRDTTIVTDRSKENLLQKEVSKHLDIQIKLKQDIVNIEEKEKQARKDRNKWRLWFFILLGAFGIYLARKRLKFLFNRVSPIKL